MWKAWKTEIIEIGICKELNRKTVMDYDLEFCLMKMTPSYTGIIYNLLTLSATITSITTEIAS